MSMDDEPTQLGSSSSYEAPKYWNNASADFHSAPSAPPPKKKPNTSNTAVIGALIAVVAILGIALAIVISKHSAATPTAISKTSSQAVQQESSAAANAGGGAKSSSDSMTQSPSNVVAPVESTSTTSVAAQNTISSMSASASEVTAMFPADSRNVCAVGDSGKMVVIPSLDVRIGAFPNSCDFVTTVAQEVRAKVLANPSVKQIDLQVRTTRTTASDNSSGIYAVSCKRDNHLSTCLVGGKENHLIYVQDK